MATQEIHLVELAPVPRSTTLTRNQIELAGLVVFFFAIAIVFVIALIVMVFETEPSWKGKAGNQTPPTLQLRA